jgi:hypothetical protein
MRLPAAATLMLGLVLAFWLVAAADTAAPAAGQATQVANLATPGPLDKITQEPYVLTWQKDPRYRGRDPFETVLHEVTGPAGKAAPKIAIPRTPGEEAAFTDKALTLVKEAEGALGDADYKAVKERIETLREMIAVKLVTQPAKDKMVLVTAQFGDLEKRYASIRARAALTEALQLAALMQGYFESGRYGEVITTEDKVHALDGDEGLRNPEVAATGAEVLKKVADLKRRAQIHVEFDKKEFKIDAVSHFPEGRSFAIVNGEVYGEGVSVEPELSVAQVDNNRVTFNFKGEEISLGLAQ